jgi:hypothetical protein
VYPSKAYYSCTDHVINLCARRWHKALDSLARDCIGVPTRVFRSGVRQDPFLNSRRDIRMETLQCPGG